MSKTTDRLLALLGEATEQDLTDLDTQIAAAEKAAAESARVAQSKITGLRKLRNIVARQLGKLPPHPNKGKRLAARATPSANGSNGTHASRGQAGSASSAERRTKVAQFIAREGPQRASSISTATDTPISSVYELMNHAWFEKDGAEWNLTPAGWSVVKDGATAKQ